MIISDIFQRAEIKALQSRKKNTKVGALLLDKNYEIIIEACNDYIYPVYDSENFESLQDKKLYSEHAERHLIYSSIRLGIHDFQDKILVVTHFPCCDCARAIILIGIRKLLIGTKYGDANFYSKWKDNINVSHRMLLQNNVEINFFNE
jgi:dCMP deaminase